MYGLKIPQSIFVQADSFFKATQSQADPPNPYDVSVLVTNCAIACELYLKCLIHIETGQLIKNLHNLKQLFGLLPAETKLTIQQRFDAVMAQQPSYDFSGAPEETKAMARAVAERMPKNLIEALRKGADAFVEWRYIYENENETSNPFSLLPFPHILRAFILERKPEWANFGFKLTKIGDALPTSPPQ